MNPIETKANELAQQVIPAAVRASFLALDLRAKLTGIATFAHLGGDVQVRDTALAALAGL